MILNIALFKFKMLLPALNFMNIFKEIGFSKIHLENLANRVDKQYKCHWELKKSGGKRAIEAPGKELKVIQKWLLKNIIELIDVHDSAHGFIKKRSIKSNAEVHLGNSVVLCMDLENFFPSISYDQVVHVLKVSGLPDETAILIGKLCCYKRRLPQGGVCSPYLSNIVMLEHDITIDKFCSGLDLDYSRYADDLTFSCHDFGNLKKVETFLTKYFDGTTFKVNTKKTRYYTGKKRMSITGVNINTRDRLTVATSQKVRLKWMLHYYFVKKVEINTKEMLGLYRHIIDVQPDYKVNLKKYIKKIQGKIS